LSQHLTYLILSLSLSQHHVVNQRLLHARRTAFFCADKYGIYTGVCVQWVCICNQDCRTMHGCSTGCGGRQGYYCSAIMAIVSGVGGGSVLSATADGHGGTAVHTRHRHTASHVTHTLDCIWQKASITALSDGPRVLPLIGGIALACTFSSSSCAGVNGLNKYNVMTKIQ